VPIIGTAECRTAWPQGYCTSTCVFTNQVCGPTGVSGWCTSASECLLQCGSPGAGQSTCRTGYVCEYAEYPDTTSHGVCVARCNQGRVCTTGTCNTSTGYCR
jgi:hypothetical protein